MNDHPSHLSPGTCAALACLMEATAPKPGNVYRGADFEDLSYFDLVASAMVIAPVLDAPHQRVGQTVLAAIRATQQAVATNSNLGMVLLLVPLTKVPAGDPLEDGVRRVLADLDQRDAADVYEAIRLAGPGGLGRQDAADVSAPPTLPLVEAMALAAERDLVARQYAGGFREVLTLAVPWLAEGLSRGYPLSPAIVRAYLRLMSQFPDSLIVRKCGQAIGQEAADRAAAVLSSGEPGDEAYDVALAGFDFWLRADGHRRNPGTTADLIAAGLYCALRDGLIRPPYRFYGKMMIDD